MIRLLRVRPDDLRVGDWVVDCRAQRDSAGAATGRLLLDMFCVGGLRRSVISAGTEVILAPSSDRSMSGVATVRVNWLTGTVRVMRLDRAANRPNPRHFTAAVERRQTEEHE